MTLHFYMARRLLKSFGMVFALFTGMIYFVNIVENLRGLPEGVGTGAVLSISMLSAPQTIYQILPLITVIAAISVFLNLARSSELVVSRAAGRSAMHTLAAPVAATLLLGAFAVAVLNPLVAATSRAYEQKQSELRHGGGSSFSISEGELWLRQGDAEGQTVIRASHADLEGTRLRNVTFLGMASDGSPTLRIDGDRAKLLTGEWQIENAKVWKLAGTDNPERDAVTHKTLNLPTSLTRAQIRDSFGTPSVVSFWDLPKFIHQLEAAGFSALKHRAWYQSQLALPLTMAAMVMIAAAFTLKHSRMGRTGLMVLLAMLCGFSLYFLGNLGTVLSENGKIPVIVGAWAPPVAGVLLILGLLLHLEDG